MTSKGTQITRVFVGWDRPLLHSLVDFLRARQRQGTMYDFGAMTVVLPGARAGRRFLELLTVAEGGEGGVIIPPRILTLGAWSSMGVEKGGTPAGPMARIAAWAAALGALGPDK